MKLIGVGDNVVDFYKDKGEIYPGGNAVNVAVLSKRYGAEKSSYLGILGNDMAGDHLAASLEAENVDISRVRKGYGQNWESIISLNDEADRIFIGSNKDTCVQAVMKLKFNQEDLAYIQTHDLLHTSMYSSIEKDLPELAQIIPISYDFSFQFEEEYIKQICPHVHYAFFSGSELTKEQCIELIEKASAYGAQVIGVTRGSKGALFYKEGTYYEQSVIETDVVDTLGAGDSFIAMFLTHYHRTNRMEEALSKAAKAAADTCKIYGAFGYGISKELAIF
ncbi:PfkB family carbohydrate kinase [Planococcus glaciei]|uniref:PfkB family carbohydrate kinase n=1 Tax=Planococcus glaciei TaxID=459472 RepID=UPI001C72A39D|nr:PfkB family carbohydrate kinase [Planococcus glaciei]MBX0315290.1 fructoselysine 6-kinase [Planococcus glaciei]